MKNFSKTLKFLILTLIYIVISIIFAYIVKVTNSYPLGNDVYGHLFKIEELYKSIQEGHWYPIYTPNWYNGIELFRYWPPASYYFYCGIMYFAGDVYASFIWFVAITWIISGFGWIYIGYKEDRLYVCFMIAVMFNLLPDNMRVFFGEGNIPRIFITMLLPYYFYNLYTYINYKRNKAFVNLSIITILIVTSHIMISAMVGVSAFILLLFDSIINKRCKRTIEVLGNLILSYIPAAFILIPGLVGGIVSQNSSASTETSSDWSLEAIKSLNPIIRLHNLDMFYFGLSLLIIIIIAILAMRRNVIPNMLAALTIFIGTTMIVLPILSALPMSQVFWMIRFIPMAEVIMFMGIVQWKQLKKSAIAIMFTLLILDCSLSLRFLNISSTDINTRQARWETDNGFEEACKVVDNRLAILDLSNFGSYTSYMITKDNRNINSAFGWAYQGAYTIKEIVNLNEAFERGYYNYVYSRLIEYGCDTVIIKKDEIKEQTGITEYADMYGYSNIYETDNAIVMKKQDIEGNFGTVPKYECVCIGTGSETLSFMYPTFHKLRDDYLDTYTYDELKDYKKIYVSGPSYKDREYCEELIEKLANNGVQIYIDMANLQTDLSRGRNKFLGVVAQPITFTKEFPIIEKEDGSQFKLKFYNEKYSKWTTAYFTNLTNVTRQSEYQKGKYLAYLGKSINNNITFIGLNLVYYCFDNENKQLYEFLDEVFDEDRYAMVDYSIVPIDVTYYRDRVIFNSDFDNVNTNVSNLDGFVSNRDLGRETFITINSGETVVYAEQPIYRDSLIVSILGLIILILYQLIVTKGDFRYDEREI